MPGRGPETRQNGCGGGQFVLGARTFEGEQDTSRADHGQAPARQPVKGCDGPRGHHVGPQPAVQGLHPVPPDRDTGQAETKDDLLQKSRAPKQWFDETDREVGPRDGEDQARETCPTAYVHDRGADRDRRCDNGAVEQMPVPHPIGFPWTDEPPGQPVGPQDLLVRHRQVVAVTEDLSADRFT